MRERFSRHLAGDGIEIGPGYLPWTMPPTVTRLRTVDRLTAEQAAARFPEVGQPFVEPDVIADIDVDGLRAFKSRSLDFVVASHVLEHFADPIGALMEIRRVLRRGGVAVILLPGRLETFDAGRPGTTVEHLIEDHRSGRTEVDDAHIVEMLAHLHGPGWVPENLAKEIRVHRARSVHVHCWTFHEFGAVLAHVSGRPGRWTVLDSEDAGDEFGWVLRRRW